LLTNHQIAIVNTVPRIKYGYKWPDDWSDISIELECYRNWWGPDEGCLGRYRHFRNALKLCWPDVEWSEWMEWRISQFCDSSNWQVDDSMRYLNLNNVGCATSGKTHDWSMIALLWWMADPTSSSVALCSIQRQMIRQRGWRVIQELHAALPGKVGHLIDSKTIIQAVKGDDKHAIFAQAVERGETIRAAQKLAGIHPERYMILIDEAPGTPEAIFEALPNAMKACREFILVTIGNAASRMDPHGQCCEPEGGWESVDQDTTAWRTRGVRKWQVKPGVCLHFHGKRSPNVKRGKTIYPYLYTYENWKDAEGKEDTLQFWVMDAGFWAPEGISNTVFDEALVHKMGGMDAGTKWRTTSETLAALDPGFGGDECVLRFGEWGDVDGGGRLLEVKEKVPIRISAKSKDPVDYQIARQTIVECAKRRVKPECFGLDATGTGRGVAAILSEEWSPLINKVEFGGAPTDKPVSQDNPVNCKDAYDRRVTELWMDGRELLTGGQLKGLDRDTVAQFCSRVYYYKGKKIAIETKEDCKKRIGRSPDDADAVVVMIDVARHRGLAPKRLLGVKLSKSRMDKALEADELYRDEDMNERMKDPVERYMGWLEDE